MIEPSSKHFYIPGFAIARQKEYGCFRDFMISNGMLYAFSEKLDCPVLVNVTDQYDVKVLPLEKSYVTEAPQTNLLDSVNTIFGIYNKDGINNRTFYQRSLDFDYMHKAKYYEAIISLSLVIDASLASSSLFPFDTATISVLEEAVLKNQLFRDSAPKHFVEKVLFNVQNNIKITSETNNPISEWTSFYAKKPKTETLH